MSSELPPLVQATSASIGSAISNALVYPLDVLTTRMQTAKRIKGSKQKESLIAVLQKIINREGWTSLYAGLGSDSLSTAISNFLYYFSHTFLRGKAEAWKLKNSPSRQKGSKAPILSAFEEIFVGCLAGVVAKAITSPLSVITVRQQTSSNKHQYSSAAPTPSSTAPPTPSVEIEPKTEIPAVVINDSDSSDDEDSGYGTAPSILSVANDIIAEKGILGLWSGFQNSIILTTNPAITLYLFDLIKRAFRMGDHPSAIQTFFAGAFASSGASAITYPLILSKTRLQFKSPSGRRLYKSNMDVFRKTIRKQGIFGMYQGLEAQITKGFLSEGVKLVVKERIELILVLLAKMIARRRTLNKA